MQSIEDNELQARTFYVLSFLSAMWSCSDTNHRFTDEAQCRIAYQHFSPYSLQSILLILIGSAFPLYRPAKSEFHTQKWRWTCWFFFFFSPWEKPSGLQAVLLKIASVCLMSLLSQIESPYWLPRTEISLLLSRAVHLCTSFYISHCGLWPLELLVFPWRFYFGFLRYSKI